MTTATHDPIPDKATKADLAAILEREVGEAPPSTLTKEQLRARISEHRAAKATDADDAPEEVEGEIVQESPDPASDDGRSAPDASGDTSDGGGGDDLTLAEVERDEARMMLARREPAPPPTALPSAKEFEAAIAMAETIAATEFVPRSYRGRPDAVVAAILAGRELGMGPMQALRDIHMIDGRPSLAAHMQLALMRRGHGKARIVILDSESTDQRAMIHARRADTGEEATVEWTIEEAERARLVNKDNWKGYPADMLWSRCVGRLTRRLGSDLVAGMPYTAEEIADFDVQNEDDKYRPLERGTVRDAAKVDHDPVPKSWPEINEWAAAYGDSFGWPEWLKQATVVLFGVEKAEDKTKLTAADRKLLGQKAASTIYALRKEFDPGELPPITRDATQKAWAKVLDGQVLPGPGWRMSPDEDGFPTYEEAHGVEAAAEPPLPASDKEPDADPANDIEWPDTDPEEGGPYA